MRFTPIHDAALNERINAAYRQKYVASPYMSHMIGASPQAATVEILFNPSGE